MFSQNKFQGDEYPWCREREERVLGSGACNSTKSRRESTSMRIKKRGLGGTSLEVQWLRLSTSNAGDSGSIPGRGTRIPHAVQGGQKKKNKRGLGIGHSEGIWDLRGQFQSQRDEYVPSKLRSQGDLVRTDEGGHTPLQEVRHQEKLGDTSTAWRCGHKGKFMFYTQLSYLWILHPRIQPTSDQKYLEKKFQKVPKIKTWICHKLTTIYIAFTLYWVL